MTRRHRYQILSRYWTIRVLRRLDRATGDPMGKRTRAWAERRGWLRHTLTHDWYMTDKHGNTALDDPRF